MGTDDDVPFFCYYNGELIDEDTNAKYKGGNTKLINLPKSIGFSSFKQKIQEITKLPTQLKIKCGVKVDESTLIAVDVDDDDSLHSVLEVSTFVKTYILKDKDVPPATTVTTSQGSNGVDHDERAKLYEVDNHQITLSISSRNSRTDNVLYMTNQVSSQVCYGSSVHYQLTNPLIRNHEDNEVDELYPPHMQENMVHKEIQFTFQRKERITSGHKPAPISTHDRLDTSVRFPNSNVVPLDKGMTNMSISNHEVNEGNEDMVHKEYGNTGQVEQIVHPSDAAIDICFGVGKEFPDIDALKIALCDMAIMTGREYKPVKTSPSELNMKCKDYRCNWHIKATRSSNPPAFKVEEYQEEHTCMARTNNGDEDHPQATIKWIASKVQSSIEKNPDIEPKKIVDEINVKFPVKISINKAMKAKNEVKEGIRKCKKESLPAPDAQVCRLLVEELKRGGSVADLGLNPVDGSFEYLFWAFSACIHALRTHLRPVLFVQTEDIALGVQMYAYGVDGNSYLGDRFEVGFAVFAREDDKAWETFMRCLKEFVLPATDNNNNLRFAIVTDFDKAILAIQNVLPDIHHFFFNYDFVRVFSEKFKGGRQLRDLCNGACIFFSAEKCSENLEAIKKINEEAYEWLLQRRRSQWSPAFSPNKHVGSEIVVSRFPRFKLILEKLSIVEIVESSRDMLEKVFSWRRMEGAEMATTEGLVPRIMDEVKKAKEYLLEFVVESVNGRKYQLTANPDSSLRIKWAEVDLDKRSCTCGEFQATEYPCDHAWVTVAHLNLDPIDYVTHRWYSLATYQATYAGSLPPPIPEHISQSQTSVTGVSFFPVKGVQAGRPKKLQRIS